MAKEYRTTFHSCPESEEAMIFSKRCSYAILALAFMAMRPRVTLQLKEIAGETKLPYHFLATIMQQLTKAGLLVSFKGKGGGFQLTRAPSEYTLLEIRSLIDGNEDFKRCFFCTRKCTKPENCSYRLLSDTTHLLLERHLNSINLQMISLIMPDDELVASPEWVHK
jgi:Rrf2 family protein